MNKISKKILAIVTMVAFVVTMMPFAAFAAEPASYQASKFMTVDASAETTQNEPVEAVFKILDASNHAAEGMGKVVVWAESVDGQISDALTVSQIDEDNAAVVATKNAHVFAVNSEGTVANNDKVNVEFSRPGTYTLYAAQVDSYDKIALGDKTETVFAGVTLNAFGGDVTGYDTVKVTAAAPADVLRLEAAQTGNDDLNTNNALDPVLDNGKASKTFTVTAYDAKTAGNVVAGKELSVSSSSGNLVVTGDTITDDNGEVELTYVAKAAGKYTITVKADKVTEKYTVDIPRETTAPENITTTVDEGTAELKASADIDLSNAVQFEVTDKNGNAVANTNENWSSEPAWAGKNVGDQKVADYVDIVDAPDKVKLDANDIKLAYVDDVYTLEFADGVTGLKAGEYTVEITLLSGKSAEATFTLAEAGDPVELVIDGNDTVAAGGDYTAKAYYVDENGIKTNATGDDLKVYYTGTKVTPTDFNLADGNVISFSTENKEAYYGTKVTLYVMNTSTGMNATKEVTIVDPTLTETVTFDYDSTNGEALTDNTVKVTLLDENGDVYKGLDGEKLFATVLSTSVEDANVSIVSDGATVNNGKASFVVYGDKEATADIMVRVAKNYQLYADTLTYTFGEQDVDANTTVAMTIGSSDIIVNNDIVSGDAAPFVDSNWRTMVPVRALSEAFGGTADWDGDARTVTVVNGDTTIVFDADSNKYTVNDEEKEMDTNLTIVDGRTYVPVRFVADELGYQITVLKDAQGLTAGVVFQK